MPAGAHAPSEIEATLVAYLARRFPHLGSCHAETQLLDGGIDSLGVLELMTFLGERFGITVEDSDFEPENLETPRLIVQFVARKQAQ